jgi:hypothetical protein
MIDTSGMLDEYIARTGGHPQAGTTIYQYEVGLLREVLARVQVALERRDAEPRVIREVIEDLILGSPSSVSHWLADELLREQQEWKPATMTISAEKAAQLRGEFGLPPRE